MSIMAFFQCSEMACLQDIYGMHINECLVRDGVGWSEQRLINDEGCPVDNEIMGQFEYSAGKTTALVRFQVRLLQYPALSIHLTLHYLHLQLADQTEKFYRIFSLD